MPRKSKHFKSTAMTTPTAVIITLLTMNCYYFAYLVYSEYKALPAETHTKTIALRNKINLMFFSQILFFSILAVSGTVWACSKLYAKWKVYSSKTTAATPLNLAPKNAPASPPMKLTIATKQEEKKKEIQIIARTEAVSEKPFVINKKAHFTHPSKVKITLTFFLYKSRSKSYYVYLCLFASPLAFTS